MRLALLAIPLVLAGADSGPAPFSHKLHVTEQEMPCNSCHDLQAEPPKLKTKGCTNCHDEEAPPWAKPTSKDLGVEFSHQTHGALDCSQCHQAVVEDAQPAGAPLLAPSACWTCHADKKIKLPEAACAKCHGVDAARVVPRDHDGTWRRGHGAAAQWRAFGEHGKTCADCHRPSTCTACHQQEKPMSHTGLWRVRTHGLAAGWERESCKTCHSPGACIRCHSTTRPVNHTAGWIQTHGLAAGGLSNESCNVCHQRSYCARCHSGR